jgi:gliding motility-associated-like protein
MRITLFLSIVLGSLNLFSQDYYSDRLFVKVKQEFKNSYKLETELNLNKSFFKSKIISVLPVSKHPLLNSTYEVIFENELALDSIISQLNQLEQIDYAEKVPLYKLFFTPNDPLYSTQWNLAKIQADLAWNLGQGCTNVKIAVTDDGFLMNHEDLVNQWHINTGEINGNGIDDDGNGYIDDWRGWDAANNDNDPSATLPTNSFFTHGTHVAGIIAGQTHNSKGIAAIGYNCKLIPIKLGLSSNSSLTGAFQGLDYAVNASGCDVINMSWGGRGVSATYQTLFNIAKTKGIICVAAAGNSWTNVGGPYPNPGFYPASYNHVISVAASASSDAKAGFSNFGATIDVTAPGVDIPSCLAGANNSYGTMSGTSMASPLVAGLCALMKCYNPMPADSIEACLKRTCDNINAQNPSFIGQVGAGRINAFQALQCLTKKPKSDFIALDTFQCIGKSVRYAARSFGIPTLTYNWSFPGGSPSTSTLANPVVTYATNGLKSATLITCNSLGCDTMTKTNYVNIDTPKASLIGRRYTSYNSNSVIITVHFRGNPPYNVTLTDGTNNFTQTNIRSNPYFFSIVPKKDTSLISISSFSDSLCVGNRFGVDTIYRVNLSGGGGSSDCDTTNLNTGLLVHLPFNGNTNDVSGNGNHATNFGATLTTDKKGNVNSAYEFNNTYMTIPTNTSLKNVNDSFSMCVNFMTTNNLTHSNIFGWNNYINGSSYVMHAFTSWNGAGRVGYSFGNQPALCNFSSVERNSTDTFARNQWHCLVLVAKGGSIKFYVDDILIDSSYFSTFMPILGQCPNASLRLARWWSGDWQSFIGKIDDFRIYNRPLKRSEVKGYCGTCNVPPPSDCDTTNLNTGKVLHLDFNGNTQDKSGNGNHATNYGATAVAGKSGLANTAYRFDGINDYMQVANSSSINNFSNNKITLCAILKPRGFYNGACKNNSILMKGNPDYLSGNYTLRYIPLNGPGGGCSTTQDTNQNSFVTLVSSAGGCSVSQIHNPPYVKRDTWYCVVGVYTGDSIYTFINGEKKYSCSYTGSIGSHNMDLFIGKLDNATFPYWLNADVDDIRVYNRSLAPSEVKGYCGTCNVPPPSDCNNWLKCLNNTDKVTVGDIDVTGNKITVEALVNQIQPSPTSIDEREIVSKHHGPADANYLLRVNQASVATTNGWFTAAGPCSTVLNKTYHVALVYDGTSIKYYRNGIKLGETAATGNLITNNHLTTISNYAFANHVTTKGYVNEVRIWNVARTQSQIQSFMNTSLPNPTTQTGLLGYYTFDNLLNKQGNVAYNGTIGGSAQINQTNPNCTLIIDSCGITVQPPPPCDTADLLACYPFSGNANDSIRTNHGTVNGANLATDRYGNSNSAYNFDGVNDEIQINATLGNFNTSDYSISFWMKMNINDNSLYRFIEKRNICNFHNFWGINIVNGQLQLEINQSNSSNYLSIISKTKVNDGNWHQVSFVRKGNDLNVYIDGKLDTVKLGTMIINSDNSFVLKFGTGVCVGLDGTKFFLGQLDDIKIYKRALNPTEVSYLYAKPFSCSCSAIQPPPCDTAQKITFTQCLNDSIQVMARMGSRYQWSPTSGLSNDTIRNPKVFVTNNQRYLVSYTSLKNCQLIDTIDIEVKASAIYPKIDDQLICIGDSVQIEIPIYATNILWSPNLSISSTTSKNPFFFPTTNRTYYLEFRDSLGCLQRDTFVVNTKVCCPARARFSIPKDLLCFGETLAITNRSKGPITSYNWNFSTAIPNVFTGANPPSLTFPSGGGTFTLRLIVTNGTCFDTMIKTVNVVHIIPYAGKDTTNCLGAFVTDLGESPISDWSYKWTPTKYLDDPNIANPKCSIVNDSVNYVLEVVDRNSGCKAYDTVVVYTNRNIDSTVQNLRICGGDSVLFNGVQRKTTGNYYFTLKKADGICDSFINVLRLNVLQKQFIPLDTLRLCEEYIDTKGKKHTQSFIEYDTIKSKSILNCDSILNVRNIIIYKRVYRDRPAVSGCAPFRYNGKTYLTSKMRADSIRIRNIYLFNCDTIEYINIIVYPKPKAVITPSIPNPVMYKQTVTLTASGGQRYLWLQTGSTNQDIEYKINNTQPKLYTVRVTDENDCWDTVSYIIKGELPDTCYYGFPNVFSPNQDNLNDEYIPNMDECTEIKVFAIYDRWGEKVFETNEQKGWKGFFKGKPAPMAVYLYYAEMITPWGIKIHKGTFTLVR